MQIMQRHTFVDERSITFATRSAPTNVVCTSSLFTVYCRINVSIFIKVVVKLLASC